MAANENDSLSQSIPNLGSIGSSLSEDDEDSGLDELISMILPEVDEEIENNATARQELHESPTLNAEEYPIIDNNDDSLPMLPPLNDNDINIHSGSIPIAPSISTNNNNNNMINNAHKTPPSKTPNAEQEECKSASPISNNLLPNTDLFATQPQLIANLPSFPIMKQKTAQNADPTDDDISGLMELNLFGQGPITNKPMRRRYSEPMPMLTQNNRNTINIKAEKDPIKEIKDFLVEMDEDENGYIDFGEFEEAIQMIDNTIIHGEIDAIYELMSGSNIPSFPGMENILQRESRNNKQKININNKSPHKHKLVRIESAIGWKHRELEHLENAMRKSLHALSQNEIFDDKEANLDTKRSKSAHIDNNKNEQEFECKNLGELNIKIFIGYIGYKYDEFKKQKEKSRSGKSPHSLLERVLSDSKLIKISSEHIADSKMIIRIAFPEIFENNSTDNLHNSLEVTTSNLWGIKTLSSLDRLTKELKDEAPDCKTLDYAEFEAAMNNLGVQFDKNNLSILFSHFIEAQSVSITSKHLHKRKELNILFFTKYIGAEVKKHESMDPKQILEAAFGQLLLKGIKRQKGSHKHILNVNNNNINNSEGSPNPYYDDDLMNDVSLHFAPDKIKKYEKNHSVKDISSSPLNGHRNKKNIICTEEDHKKLLRMESGLKWKGNELDDLESAMQAQFKLLMDQHETAKSQQNINTDINNIINTDIGIVHEDQAIE